MNKLLSKVLVISQDQPFLKGMIETLREEGYVVLASDSVEDSSAGRNQNNLFLVIVDAGAASAPGNLCQWRESLECFYYRARVILLIDETSPVLECECDYCLPKTVEKARLLSCIKELRHQVPAS